MDDDQQFCLRWNNHQSTLISVFDTLLENGTLVDCTLAAEGKFLKAHKVVLSACSPYFAALLSQQYDKHPIFILKDIKYQELRAMMDYMYRGEVNISQDQLAALLKAAESLQIKGLSESRGGSTQKNDNIVQKQPVPVVSKSGLTIEHKRPVNKHPTSVATESDVSMSREGSTSPTSRKRKKFRRRSTDVNNMDNHDQLSNSSSQSMHQQSIHTASSSLSQITSATSAANVLNVTKKTDHHDSKKDMEQNQADDDEDDDKNDIEPPAQRQKHDMDVSHIKEKMQSTHSELLIEPKNEYDDAQDETVEDLTLDDEELLEDLDQAGPSHGGEGSSQGYAQWQVGQGQDEVFLAAQEAAGQHRDAQESPTLKQEEIVMNESLLESEDIIISRKGNNFVLKTALKKYGTSVIKSAPVKRTEAEPPLKKISSDCGLYKISNVEKPKSTIFQPKSPVTIVKTKPLALIKSQETPEEPANSTIDIIDDFSTEYQEIDEVDDIDLVDDSGVTIKSDGTEVHKYSIVAVGSSKKQEVVLNDCSNSSFHYDINSESSLTEFDDQRELYACRHCGKKYRWKSTLRRHETVECGGKEPRYSCPYCEYKAKQRGNLGVHVRKHHPDRPQLQSSRKRVKVVEAISDIKQELST